MALPLNVPAGLGLGSVVRQWSVASQQQARRNAMLATNSLLRQRIERDDVHDFLAARHGETVPALQQVTRAAHG